MKLFLSLVVIAALVAVALAWSAQREVVAEVRETCESAGLDRDDCVCHAKKFRERATLVSFIGVGEFRPLSLSRSEINQAVIKAGALCLAERMLK